MRRAPPSIDLDLAREGYALMVVLAGRSAGDRLNVLRPAPTRLVHLAGDINLAEDHHLHVPLHGRRTVCLATICSQAGDWN